MYLMMLMVWQADMIYDMAHWLFYAVLYGTHGVAS
jgi:hypothetical protein